jgi:hypothetical protein
LTGLKGLDSLSNGAAGVEIDRDACRPKHLEGVGANVAGDQGLHTAIGEELSGLDACPARGRQRGIGDGFGVQGLGVYQNVRLAAPKERAGGRVEPCATCRNGDFHLLSSMQKAIMVYTAG